MVCLLAATHLGRCRWSFRHGAGRDGDEAHRLEVVDADLY